jgi:hypothetical protein
MSDTRLPVGYSSEPSSVAQYRIMRKGSRYNILGPQGRIFTKYKSASVAGPRWEELTHTPWPYESTAYERGLRLWELGLIPRDQVGKRNILMSQPEPNSKGAITPSRAGRSKSTTKRPIWVKPPLALPAPRIDLAEQERLMQALRRSPTLLFDPAIRQALHHEVHYHRPQARWAKHLLDLLARYEKRQRVRRGVRVASSAGITAKHVAWQAQRMRTAAVV